MSVKYFGEFLINKGVLKTEALIKALITQVSSQPPVCQIAWDAQIFSPEEFMSIFRYQQDHDADFIKSCRELGLWSDEKERKIKVEMTKLRTPLGEVLVKRGDIDLKTLTHMLDEYLAQAEAQIVTEPEPEADVSSEVEDFLREFDSEQEESAQEPEEEFTEYQEGILMEFEDIYDERKRKVLKVALSLIKDKSVADEKGITKLFHDSLKISHTINGLLKLFGVQNLGKIVTFSEKLIECHLQKQKSPEVHQKAAAILYLAYEEAWKLRNSLLETKSEKSWFSDRTNKTTYEKLINDLMTAIGEAG